MNLPRLDERRRRQLEAELVRRGRSWLPEWRPRGTEADLAGAFFAIAARIGSEVTQRLDRVPEKAFRGFLHWLGVRGEAARAARLPVVFVLTPGSEPVLAPAGVQVQAPLDGQEPVFFETEEALRLVPATLQSIVGADAANDRFFLPSGGLSPLEPAKPSPGEWRVKSLAAADATQLQLEPELGLAELASEPGVAELKVLVHERTGLHYRVTKVEGGIVDIEPPLGTGAEEGQPRGAEEGDRVTAVKTFRPFEKAARNRQVHAIYIGSESLLNIEGAAEIEIRTSQAAFGSDVQWAYWGKTETAAESGWQKLEPKPRTTPLTLVKPPGPIDITKVGALQSRWLRGLVARDLAEGPLRIGNVVLAVNCTEADPPCPVPAGEPRSTVPLEAMAGAAPVVRGASFFPLGPEPRQFDSFYVGSAEAFSKPNADVSLCLELEDGSTRGYGVSLIGDSGLPMLFAVGNDGNLHRLALAFGPFGAPFRRLAAVRPPFAENGIAAGPFAPAPLNRDQPAGLGTVARAAEGDAIVAVTAGDDAWLWRQTPDPARSRWFSAGRIFDPGLESAPPPSEAGPAVIVLRKGDGLVLVASNGPSLYTAELDPGWESAPSPRWRRVEDAPAGRTWIAVLPVSRVGQRLKGPVAADGWVALAEDGSLAIRRPTGWKALDKIRPIDVAVTPLALALEDGRTLFVVQEAGRTRAWTLDDDVVEEVNSSVEANPIRAYDWKANAGSAPAIVFANETAQGTGLAAWFPLGDAGGLADTDTLYAGPVLASLVGRPTVADGLVVAPGERASVLMVPFAAGGLAGLDVPRDWLEDAVLFERPDPPFEVDDFIAIDDGTDVTISRLTAPPTDLGTAGYLYRPGLRSIESAELYRPVPDNSFEGEKKSGAWLELASGDENARTNGWILVERPQGVSRHRILEVDEASDPWKVRLTNPLTGASGTAVDYWYVPANGDGENRIVPYLSLHDVPATVVRALTSGGVYFGGGARPARQAVLYRAMESGPGNYAVLGATWELAPGAGTLSLLMNGLFGQVIEVAAPAVSVTARLSWEYWDGTSWWTIPDVEDGTNHLRGSGRVRFCVPANLEPTDVAGRSSHWIRARLVEGDYGRERVTVKTAPDPNTTNGTVQTVERSRAEIAAPEIVWMDLRYSICCPAAPDHVVTEDGGGRVDRSVANKTAGATVEALMPLRETIARASRTIGQAGQVADAGDPALYLGFDAAFRGGPISLLFLVEEGSHDEAFPLRVDALREAGFDPIATVEDGTRGLNESGVVSFSLSAPPAAVDLFGRSGFWLRLRPSKVFGGTWDPRLRAVYLNATMASAAETQVEELLGSSDGAPNQTVFLARPPVLDKTLRLRVRERLAEEEVEELRRTGGKDEVLDQIGGRPGRPGPWVLWRKVVDPLDQPADARAYSLDEVSGAIRFGNGLHGRIPPIDTDSILAERYRRGGGAAANAVGAWSQVTLVTPVQGVERVVVPDGAAGGSDAQKADAVVQFAPANQLMRGRALTLRDLEMTALQFSPDVAQVRALERAGRVRLVVAMRGSVRSPSRAVVRELRRHLVARALPSLGEKDALAIVPPRPVPVGVGLILAIDDVEHSGAVSEEAERRVRGLLDPATGGLDGAGWRFGEPMLATDIAARLDGIDDLEGVEQIEVSAIRPDGELVPLPAVLPPDRLVELSTVSVEFRVAAREHVA